MSRVLMVASEAAPFAKTGGLADVLGSLPAALAARGEEVVVVLPRYRKISLAHARKVYERMELWVGPGRYQADIWLTYEKGVPFLLVDIPALYDRDGIYGEWNKEYWDNHTRYAALCHAGLAVARSIFRPDIIHCHDWQTGLLPVFLRQFYRYDPTFYNVKVVFTIHNLGYQGEFGRDSLFWLGLPDSFFHMDALEAYGKVNLLKGGLVFSDHLTTVSRAYAREIQTPEYGFGLDGLLRARAGQLTGILNGVDYHEWNPAADPHIAAHYTADDLSGKWACKRDLLEAFGLPTDRMEVPVIGIVSRLAKQKGFDLIQAAAAELQQFDIRMVVLGTGEREYEEMFQHLAWVRPDKFACRIAYDNRLAHKIEAGADMFLMPSRYEPCGLNQIYSLRYGTVPVVRATGGLDDTIDESTGFKFHDYHPGALLWALRQALDAYYDAPRWDALRKAGMRKDYSWEASAAEYASLYRQLRG